MNTTFTSHARHALGCLAALMFGAITTTASHAAAPAAGPFEIQTNRHRDFRVEYGNELFSIRTTYDFKLNYRGKAMSFTDVDRSETSRGSAPDEVLDLAYFFELHDKRVALVATHGSSFLVTEEQGKPVTARLETSAFAGFQWLDNAAGQPGEKIYSQTRSVDDPRTLAGGKLLLLYNNMGAKIGVLDVANLKFHPLLNADREKRMSMVTFPDGYRDDGGLPARARAVSPSRTQYVQLVTRYTDDKPQFGFEVVDFVNQRYASVPLDVDATRLNNLRKITPAWINRHYEWTTGKDGTERFALKRLSAPQAWTGYFTDRAVESAQYRLLPVAPDMQATFINFLQTQYGAVPQPARQGQTSLTLLIQGDQFDLTYYKGSKTLVFEPALGLYLESAIAACEKMTADFDRQLAAGAHQALFTKLSPNDIWAEH